MAARNRKGVAQAPAAADEVHEGSNGVAVAEAPAPQVNGNGSHAAGNGNGGEKRRPEISYRLNTDRTTSVEVSIWLNTYTNQHGEEYEQASMTIQRSYRDQNEQWCKGGSWRNHDLPILIYLLQKAHAWALDRRLSTTMADCPF